MDIKGKHLFALARIGKNIDMEELIKVGKDKTMDAQAKGIVIIKAVMELMGEYEKELTELIADIKGVKAKEIAEQPIEDLVKDIEEIINNEQIQGFMKTTK
ncbi:hypothetical protein DP149_10250 [Clostridium tetani]|uniref:hypothetical protein n=1 Tax=Clostridium tetani TaxID=1513 RepID=UPI0002D759E2|nr:hypothetical protein [Clostridium tetani]KGI37950.1 hypothetical protein KY52_10495 [Clostridium tetani]KGI45327.1 hypothetical protein KY54_04265 [Clostridium tetani]KHO31949.1 hypothetical protein OR63_07900 [Clostridium tetani]KIG22132.1 hypothetical protein RS78_00475 [Clostridium tetani]RXI62106.1 hypothetical protein DP125_04820 [Clostridium tetani]